MIALFLQPSNQDTTKYNLDEVAYLYFSVNILKLMQITSTLLGLFCISLSQNMHRNISKLKTLLIYLARLKLHHTKYACTWKTPRISLSTSGKSSKLRSKTKFGQNTRQAFFRSSRLDEILDSRLQKLISNNCCWLSWRIWAFSTPNFNSFNLQNYMQHKFTGYNNDERLLYCTLVLVFISVIHIFNDVILGV